VDDDAVVVDEGLEITGDDVEPVAVAVPLAVAWKVAN